MCTYGGRVEEVALIIGMLKYIIKINFDQMDCGNLSEFNSSRIVSNAGIVVSDVRPFDHLSRS
jgi:hypothetical protein